MIDIRNVEVGKTYACKFKVEHMLDTYGRIPGLSDTPLQGLGWYEGFGVLMQRDSENELVKVLDEQSEKEFVVPLLQIGYVDVAEQVEEYNE